MGILVRLAWSLAFGREASNLWRRIALTVSITIVAIVSLVVLAMVSSLDHERERSQGRVAISVFAAQLEEPIGSNEPGLWVFQGLGYFEDEQYIIQWIEPNSTDSLVLPPGVAALPEPGMAVVSPALADAIRRDTALQDQYPNYEVLDWAGVVDADELYAWVRPIAPSLVLDSDRRFFISEFVAGSSQSTVLWSTLNPPMPERYINLFAVMVILIPSFLILTSGLATHSLRRNQRIQTLRKLGCGDRSLVLLNSTEALLLSVPVCLIVMIILAAVLRQQTWVPLLNLKFVPGDLALTWRQVGGVFIFVQLLVVLSSMLEVALSRLDPASQRLRNSKRIWHSFQALGIAGAVYLGTVYASNSSGDKIFIFGANVLIILVVVPGLLQQLYRPVAASLSGAKSVAIQLGASRLAHLHSDGFRPYVGLSLAFIILLQGLGFVAVLKHDDEFVDNTLSPSSARVSSAVPADTIQRSLTRRLPDALVFPVYDYRDVGGPVFVISCEEVANFLERPEPVCDSGVAGDFGTTFADSRAQFNASFTPANGEDPAAVMIVSRDSMYMTDQQVRAALPVAAFPGLFITTPESLRFQPSPLVPWLEHGVIFGAILIGVATLIRVINQSMAGRKFYRQLVRLGTPSRTLNKIEAALFLIPAALLLFAGYVIGVLELFILRRISPFSWDALPIGSLLVSGVVVIFASTALVTYINTRIAFMEGKISNE